MKKLLIAAIVLASGIGVLPSPANATAASTEPTLDETLNGGCYVTDIRAAQDLTEFTLEGVGFGPDPLGTSTHVECWIIADSISNPPVDKFESTERGHVSFTFAAFSVTGAAPGDTWYACGMVTSQPSGRTASLGCRVAFTY